MQKIAQKIFSVNTILFLIIIIGSCLRFYHLGDVSLSNDELSAVFSAKVESLSDVPDKVAEDVHPIGIELLLVFITKTFGDNAFPLRIPFAIAGILSIIFTYLIARQYFNKGVGLFSASFIAFLPFFIKYSQQARPYSIGLLFVLIFTWLLGQFLFQNKNKKELWIFSLLLGISAAFAAYTHYFALLSILVIGVTSLVFVTKEKLFPLVGSGAIGAILFAPHLPLTFGHFFGEKGLSWLPKPEEDVLFQFLSYLLNNSLWLIFFVSIIGLIFFYLSIKKDEIKDKKRIWFVAVFLVHFAIIYYKSKFDVPVLQYSSLIFITPLFIIAFCSLLPKGFYQKHQIKWNVFICLFSAFLLNNMIYEKEYYAYSDTTNFKAIAEDIVEWNRSFEGNVTNVLNYNNEKYFRYYEQRFSSKSIALGTTLVYERKEFEGLIQLSKTEKDVFVYAWAGLFTPSFYPEIIQEEYPILWKKNDYFNGKSYSFVKPNNKLFKYTYYNSFEELEKTQLEKYSSLMSKSGQYSAEVGVQNEFGYTWRMDGKSKNISSVDSLIIIGDFFNSVYDSEAQIVFAIQDKTNNKSVHWKSWKVKSLIKNHFEWNHARISTNFPEMDYSDKELRVFLYDPMRNSRAFMDNLTIIIP